MDALVFVSRGTVDRRDIYARDPKDLLLGTIQEADDRSLFIKAASEPRIGVKEGPYVDLDAAMSAIADQLNGTCEKWSP
jgi:hypothetical protein